MSKRAKRKQRTPAAPTQVLAVVVPPKVETPASAQEVARGEAILADLNKAIVGVMASANLPNVAIVGGVKLVRCELTGARGEMVRAGQVSGTLKPR